MDTEVLNSIPDCKAVKDRDGNVKPCHWWDDRFGKCYKKNDIPCPQGVRQPQQEFVETEYNILG